MSQKLSLIQSTRSVQWALTADKSQVLEHPNYHDSAIGYSFRDAAKQGHMSVKQIPEPLR
jgi:hypothetical protein